MLSFIQQERENIHVQTKSKGYPKLVMPTPRGRSGGAQMRSGKRRTSHEYTLYTVLQFKIILPSKCIVYLLKTYSSCRFTQFPNKHLRHLPFLHEHFRDISVLSDKPSAVDNQRSEAVGGQAYVALSLTYYCFDWILEWVAMPFSRRPSQPRDRNWNSCILVDSLPSEPPGNQDSFIPPSTAWNLLKFQ